MARPQTRYTSVAIALHWLIAAAIVVQLVLGWRMGMQKGPGGYALFQLHKSVGISILLLSLGRLAWRLAHRPPPLPANMPLWERTAARAVHWGFYAVLIGLPLTGWALVSASPTNIPTLLFNTVPWPHLPLLSDLPPAAKKNWSTLFSLSHLALAYGACALLILHVAAALKHQWLDHDGVLGAMLPGSRSGAWLEPRLLGVLAAALALAGGAFAYQRAGPAPARPAAAPSLVSNPAADASPPALVSAPAAKAPPLVTLAQSPSPSATTPDRWTVVKGSTLGFAADWSGDAIDGRFARWEAEILFSPEALDASRLTVTVDIASATTGDAQRDASLPTPDWFDAARHPKAVFTAASFRKTGPGRYIARGRLDLRGVSVPLSLPFTLAVKDDTAIVSGSAVLDRTRFGVGQGEWASTDQIAAKVKVSVVLTAMRAGR